MQNNIELNIGGNGTSYNLGAALGNSLFCDECIQFKVKDWYREMEKSCNFAISQPQAAFSAYIHRQQHKFTYFLCTFPDIGKHLKPLDDIINEKLIPALFG